MSPVGKIIRYYGRTKMALVDLYEEIRLGDSIRIEKEGEGFDQVVSFMKKDEEEVERAKKGELVSVKVIQIPKKGAILLQEKD